MNSSKTLDMKFSIDESEKSEDLHVNIILQYAQEASKWHNYKKTLTVIHNGKVLVPHLQENNVIYTTVEATKNKKVLQLPKDNPFYRHADAIDSYSFYEDEVRLLTTIKSNKEYKILYDPKYEDNINNKSLYLIEPKTASQNITELSDIDIVENFRSLSFEELLEAEKISSTAILKFDWLTETQKNTLLEEHSKKKYNKF